jgi:uncharacterized membrane protein
VSEEKSNLGHVQPPDVEGILRRVDAQTFNSIPNKVKPQVVTLFGKALGQPSLIAQVTQYSGPLPPSEELERYNQVVPGLADRLVTTFEKQASHRMELEKLVITNQVKEGNRGQIIGAILAILFLFGALWITHDGYPWVGGTIGGTTVVSLATLFVLGKKAQKQDLNKKH